MMHSGFRPLRRPFRLAVAVLATVGIAVGATLGALPALAQTNQSPVTAPDSATTSAGSPVTIAVLDNDSDPDGGTLSVTAVTDPPHGSASINTNDTITYTPDSGYLGADAFFYIVTDGQGGSASGQVTLQVNENQAPVATDDSGATDEDTAVTLDVLANDTDADGDELSVAFTSGVSNGTAAVNADDTVTFTPAANFNGTAAFSYTVEDPDGASDTGTVTVTVNPVNDAPTAAADMANTPMNTAVTIDVLANDSDLDGDTLSVTSAGPAANGVVTINASGSVTYTPVSGFSGTDTFSYTVSDGNGGTANGNVVVTVGDNDAPNASDDTAHTRKNRSVTINVLRNDSDADGDTLSVTNVSDPAHGAAMINTDGRITYTPDTDFKGTDTFTYTVSDGQGGTDTAQVTVRVGEDKHDLEFVIFRIRFENGATAEFRAPAVLERLFNRIFGDENVDVLPLDDDDDDDGDDDEGRDRDRVTICHIPPGNPSNAHTIRVGRDAVDAHLAHGDERGECDDDDLRAAGDDDDDDDRHRGRFRSGDDDDDRRHRDKHGDDDDLRTAGDDDDDDDGRHRDKGHGDDDDDEEDDDD